MNTIAANDISKKLADWMVDGPDYTTISFSKRGDSIRVKVEMNGSPDEVLPVVDMARVAMKASGRKIK
tara:strand:+ start:539 stop:742 length:204 start_codon:yes stop_codon:yes gene_type:complete